MVWLYVSLLFYLLCLGLDFRRFVVYFAFGVVLALDVCFGMLLAFYLWL